MAKNYQAIQLPVLIIDDEPALREVVAEVVTALGLTPIMAESGDAALKLFPMNPSPFLVISDHQMPGIRGVALCTEVKKFLPAVHFILISGHVDKQIAIDAVKNGISEIIEKPFGHEALVAAISRYADKLLEEQAAEARESAEITELFLEEATSLIESVEKNILRLEEVPLDPSIVDLLFRNVHSVKGGAGAIPGGKWLAKLGHSFESCLSNVKSGKLQVEATAVEVFLLTIDFSQQLLGLIRDKREPDPELLGAIELCIKSLDAVREGRTAQPAAAKAGVPAATGAHKDDKKDGPGENDGVWVTNEKLDSFMRLSGELIVLKNYFQVLQQEAELKALSARVVGRVSDFSHSLNKITDHLQDQIMSIRKVTMERAMSKLPRIFRQVTREVNKKVRLETDGFSLGVDRTIANALSICMTHLLRNAIDHGIESAPDRAKTGKPEEGLIKISTREQKGTIFLSISDDGGGINKARVVAKAIEKGLLEEARKDSLTDAEVYELLFLPGFSTAEKVTGISGRGVGMDAVKSEIVNLKGKIRIESELGRGSTFHFEIPVPKTVMVEQTLLARSQDTWIAVPLNAIAQLTTSSALVTSFVGQRHTCQFQDKTVPLLTYSEVVGRGRPETLNPAEDAEVVVLQYKNAYLGLVVDGIYDQLEAVIRPFDKVTSGFPGFKGTTVLGDDNIAFVVAPEDFVAMGLGIKPDTKEAS